MHGTGARPLSRAWPALGLGGPGAPVARSLASRPRRLAHLSATTLTYGTRCARGNASRSRPDHTDKLSLDVLPHRADLVAGELARLVVAAGPYSAVACV